MSGAAEGTSKGEEKYSSNPGCRHGLSDTGKNIIGTILQAVAAAIAGINTAAAIDLANKQYDIAKDYLEIAEWWRDYYNSTFAPIEDQELDEAVNLEEVEPMYDMAVGRAKTFSRLQFKGLANKSIQCTSEYCTGLRAALLKDVVVSEATAAAAVSNLGYRNERAYVEARNDVRWQRRYGVVQRGRNMIAGNIQYAQLAFGIFGDLGKQAGQGAAGAVKYLGYSFNRNATQYPTLKRGVAERPPAPPAPPPAPQPVAMAAPEPDAPLIRSGTIYDPSTGEWRGVTAEDKGFGD